MKKKTAPRSTDNTSPSHPSTSGPEGTAHTGKETLNIAFSHIIEFSPFPVVIVNDNQMIEYVNPRFTDVFGYTADDLHTSADWFNSAYPDPEYRSYVMTEWSADHETFVHKNSISKSFHVTCKNGLIKHITFHVTRTNNKTVIFFEDTTERDNAETELKTTNRRYKSIIEHINDALFIHDFNGTILDVNDNTLKMTGYTLQELLGKNLRDLGRTAIVHEKIKKLFDRDSLLFEGILTRKDGTPVPVSVSSRVVARDGKGIVQAFARDLSEMKKSAELLQQSEEKYRLIFERTPVGILHFDQNGIIRDCNDNFVRIIGTSREKLIGLNMLTALQNEEVKNAVKDALNGKAGYYEGIYNSITADKSTYVRALMNSIFAKNGNFIGGVGIIEDISARKQAVEALRQSEEKYRGIIENSFEIVYTLDMEGNFTNVNEAFLREGGFTGKEIIGRSMSMMLHPEDAHIAYEAFEKGKEGIPCTFIMRSRKHDGTYSWYLFVNNTIKDSNGIPAAIHGIARNIDEQKRAEHALAREKERLRVTLQSIADGVITTDITGSIVSINRVAEELTGWTQQDAEGQEFHRIFNLSGPDGEDATRELLKEIIETGSAMNTATRALLKSASSLQRQIEYSAAPIRDQEETIVGMVAAFRDISEKLRIEEELRKTQKLESLGILAGGIAHDFNNILTAIVGNLSIVKMHTSPSSDSYHILTQAEKATIRAKDLTRQLLTFAKGGSPVKQAASIEDLIRDSSGFVLRGANVSCSYNFDKDLRPVDIDRGQISQVIQNLILNANEAMPEGGTITINAENADIGTGSPLQLSPGKYVKIEIEDTGIGIPEQYHSKIFDPFFTTKQKGSGLGLSIAYSIIRRHNGRITIESKPDKGTVFTLYLPATGKKPVKQAAREATTHCSNCRILLMDDEEIVRDAAGQMLIHLGYDVTFAADGEEMLEKYKKAMNEGTPFDAAILDLTIPGGTGGKESIKRLLELDPDAKAIVSSGYSHDPVMSDYRIYGFSGAIGKPYMISDLGEILSRVITKK